ncbi:MAG TPA: hypothetical protein ENH82_16710 [bacterium]|nr:hypothetical protein [bacterium]
MSLIDRAATFRGNVVDHAVSVTKNEFPQFVCKLVAKEIYDEEEQVWVDWTDVDENEITAYVVLYGSKGETLSSNQVKKVCNWDGASFQALNDGDYSETGIQFRVEEKVFQKQTRLQVSWIDEYDAVPGRSVRKLDQGELKQLDAKYAQFLKAGGKKAAPVKASGAKAGIVKNTKSAKPTSPKGPVKKVEKQTATEAIAGSKSDLSEPPAIPSDDVPTGHCTKDEAWNTVVEMRDSKISDSQLAECWSAAVKDAASGKQSDELTEEEWFKVQEKVMSETAVF